MWRWAVGNVKLQGWEDRECEGLRKEVELVAFFQCFFPGSPLKSCSWKEVPTVGSWRAPGRRPVFGRFSAEGFPG